MCREKMHQIVIMDFSGVYGLESFYEGEEADWVEVQGLPGCNCYCDEEARQQLQEKIREYPAFGMHFIDSGNYHYMSRIWLEKLQEPFRLLVLDNHTDMQPPAFGGILSCGGWIQAALEELPYLEEVILVGPDEEAFAQIETKWKEHVRFLSREELQSLPRKEIRQFFREIGGDLPLYISIDKDVLSTEDACTGWSQGDMRISELVEYLELAAKACREAGQRIAGVDVCGESSDASGMGHQRNDRANLALLKWYCRQEEWLKERIKDKELCGKNC